MVSRVEGIYIKCYYDIAIWWRSQLSIWRLLNNPTKFAKLW